MESKMNKRCFLILLALLLLFSVSCGSGTGDGVSDSSESSEESEITFALTPTFQSADQISNVGIFSAGAFLSTKEYGYEGFCYYGPNENGDLFLSTIWEPPLLPYSTDAPEELADLPVFRYAEDFYLLVKMEHKSVSCKFEKLGGKTAIPDRLPENAEKGTYLMTVQVYTGAQYPFTQEVKNALPPADTWTEVHISKCYFALCIVE